MAAEERAVALDVTDRAEISRLEAGQAEDSAAGKQQEGPAQN